MSYCKAIYRGDQKHIIPPNNQPSDELSYNVMAERACTAVQYVLKIVLTLRKYGEK